MTVILRTEATEDIGDGQGTRVEMPLPMIEGYFHRMVAVQYVLPIATMAPASLGLSHHRSILAPTSLHLAFIEEDSIWDFHQFGAQSESTRFRDLRHLELDVAGPQTFLWFNGTGNFERASCVLWYTTRRGNLADWADLARRTSYEDRE